MRWRVLTSNLTLIEPTALGIKRLGQRPAIDSRLLDSFVER